MGQVIQNQNWLDIHTIICVISWVWYCHWWVKGRGCSYLVLWNCMKIKQQQHRMNTSKVEWYAWFRYKHCMMAQRY